MAHASTHGWHSGRAFALMVGALTAAGLSLSLVQAEPPAKSDTKPGSTIPAKLGNKPGDKPSTKPAASLTKFERVHPLPPGTSKDIVEAVELINTSLANGWKENKLI